MNIAHVNTLYATVLIRQTNICAELAGMAKHRYSLEHNETLRLKA